MAGHPDQVPADHQHGGNQYASIKKVAARAIGELADGIGTQRHANCPNHSEHDATAHEPSAIWQAAGRCADDRDDERRFQHLSKHQ